MSTETGLVRGDTRNQVIISIRDQKLTVVQPDHHRVTFPISTSKFGFGDRRGSYATPLGELEVAQKIGAARRRAACSAAGFARARSSASTRRGATPSSRGFWRCAGWKSKNRDAYARGIYIHGTPEERNIGRPSSYGCIRMRSRDVITLYDMVGVGAQVQIIDTTVNQAIAANIVTPTAPPLAVAAARASSTHAADYARAPGAGGKQRALRKSAPGNMSRRRGLQAAKALRSGDEEEWAGSPSKLLAKEAKADEKAKNAKPIGAARASASATSEASYNTNGTT